MLGIGDKVAKCCFSLVQKHSIKDEGAIAEQYYSISAFFWTNSIWAFKQYLSDYEIKLI